MAEQDWGEGSSLFYQELAPPTQNADYGSPLHYGTTLWLDGFSCPVLFFLLSFQNLILFAFLTHSQCLLQGGLYWHSRPRLF